MVSAMHKAISVISPSTYGPFSKGVSEQTPCTCANVCLTFLLALSQENYVSVCCRNTKYVWDGGRLCHSLSALCLQPSLSSTSFCISICYPPCLILWAAPVWSPLSDLLSSVACRLLTFSASIAHAFLPHSPTPTPSLSPRPHPLPLSFS